MSSDLLNKVDELFSGATFEFYFSPGERNANSDSKNPTSCYTIYGSTDKTLFQLLSENGSLFHDTLKVSDYFISIINDFHAENFINFYTMELMIFGSRTRRFEIEYIPIKTREDHDHWIKFFLSAMELYLALQ